MKYIKQIVLITVFGCSLTASGWGFYCHKLIGEWSIYSLPEGMFEFYNLNKAHIIRSTVLPDVLKNTVPKEYCRHYIDIEHYDTVDILTFNSDSCLQIDTCFDRGILPFIIKDEYKKLVLAFRNQNSESILRQSGVLSHYCSDLCVPLHTTENYNGQLTGQIGIHALWESYLPEQHTYMYNLYVDKAVFVDDIEGRILKELTNAHRLVKPLLENHKGCQNILNEKSYGFYERKGEVKEGYSEKFQNCFHSKVFFQIEEQMKRSIQLSSDLWYSAWILAGKPNLNTLGTPVFIQKTDSENTFLHKNFDKRVHE